MKREYFPRGRALLTLLFISSHLLVMGCNDDSKTTGTMVEVSDETKAHQAAKRGNYKGGPPKPSVKAASKNAKNK
jgi:hypothetical protein